MDSITQAALGGLCGEVVLRKKLGNWGMVWGFLFGTLPDLDILFYPWLDEAGRLAFHRGVSHSILAMIVGAVLFGWILSKVHRKRGVTFREGATFVFLAWSTHVLIDCFTVYGTQVFAPFSELRVSFDNLFIIDLFFTVPMLIGLCVVLFLNRDSAKRRKCNRGVVIWLLSYTLLSFGVQGWARNSFEKRLAERGIKVERMQVAATLSNVFLWRMVAEREDEYLVAYWTPWDGGEPRDFSRAEKKHELIEKFAGKRDFETLRWFSKGYFIARESENGVMVADMRFGEIRTEVDGNRFLLPTFRWELADDGRIPEGGMGRPDVDMSLTLREFWSRLKGGAAKYTQGEWN